MFGVRKDPDPAELRPPFLRRLQRILTWLAWSYLVLMVSVLVLVHWRGESNWFFSAMLFLPAAFWLAPLLILLPALFVARPRLCVIPLVGWLFVSFVYLDFCWSFAGEREEPGLTVLTNNIGERELRTLEPFLKKENPDVIGLQEIWAGGGRDLRKEFPDRFFSIVGECALISRYPILNARWVYPAAARFEIEFQKQRVAIYQVHLPSPRAEFGKLRGRGLIREMFGGGGFYSKKARDSYSSFVQRKAKMSRELITALEKEPLPFLIVGDFNMPSNGKIAGLFRSQLADAFKQKGRGHGNTFPGFSDNRFAEFIGPWLRLDYLFAGKDWETLMCRVEPRVPAQHLAVVARFKLRPAAHNP